FSRQAYIRQPVFVNENCYAYKVLEQFKTEKKHYGIVIDEYGNTVGMVTMHDVLDALVGPVSDEDAFDYRITETGEHQWLADGQVPIVEFLKFFDLDYDFENANNYTTLVGFFLDEYGGTTEVGQKVTIDNLELEITEKEAQRVNKIKITAII